MTRQYKQKIIVKMIYKAYLNKWGWTQKKYNN